MSHYDFNELESRWQKHWQEKKIFEVQVDHSKPKYYVLDMFPYPSGAGLHVGHPLGYIASDIFTRYKILKGFNVLHPMGFDAFGLPAEQYAIQTGQHPAITTDNNIKRYKDQLQKIGFAYDWSREVRTSDPDYYKWTQWVFIQLFKSWYDKKGNKAESIDFLINEFEKNGNKYIEAACSETGEFSSPKWKSMSEKEQQSILMNYRLAYLADTTVNWCPALGTVLANDEVKDGLSARGGHPVEQKLMRQWLLRVTAYNERLLEGLDTIEWSDSLKEMQRNWIGRSEGALIKFKIENSELEIEVFTTRQDTLFGSTFIVLAPEHNFVRKITTVEYKKNINYYIEETKKRTERERMSETKGVTGEFTGAYAIHPFSGEKMPIWIADYILIQYGTGAVMSVPAHDKRDYLFAKHFDLPIKKVITRGNEPDGCYEEKAGKVINSDFISGLSVEEAIELMNKRLEEEGIGESQVNYKMHDAIFSRQRYWGEPFPIYYKDDVPYVLEEEELPLELPQIDKFKPSTSGDAPLAQAKNWVSRDGYKLETHTMPGFAGSSAYYLRYMDPHNKKEFFSKEANDYWQEVDLYIGGTEHATGHLIYSRFWNKFLYDLGYACREEPFSKLVNQGMIQGQSSFVYRVNMEKYAEYLVWEKIKDSKSGVTFLKDYRKGTRRFDFFCEKSKLVIEIKSEKNLIKLANKYKEFFDSYDYSLLLIPIWEIVENIDNVFKKIENAIKGDIEEILFDHELKQFKPKFISHSIKNMEKYTTPIHVDVNIVENNILDIDAFKVWRPEFIDAEFVLEDGVYYCGSQVEKMSKSLHNVVNPDDVIEKYGADTFRMYEMFLGPIEQHKPWNTDGIEGVSKFLRKLWRLFFNDKGEFNLSSATPNPEELKILHKTIKKTEEGIERLSFNTCVSNFMIAVNELSNLQCNNNEILKKLLILLSPFAPHISEELWQMIGNQETIFNERFPEYDKEFIKEDVFEYPVSVNGKLRTKHQLPVEIDQEAAEKEILELPVIKKWTEGKIIRKIIFVRNKIINIVVN